MLDGACEMWGIPTYRIFENCTVKVAKKLHPLHLGLDEAEHFWLCKPK